MATTAATLLADVGVSLFYYLKITGIPYYFFSVVNPTDTQYGAAAWTLPAGYSAARGMDLPDDTLQQKMGDLIGGIASAERIRLTLRDFDVTDSNGSYRFLSKLFSPGRMSAAGALAELASQINVTDDGPFTTFAISNSPGTFAAQVVHVGGEAIAISGGTAPDSTGRSVLTIAAGGRNKYPCTSTWPPPQFHRVVNADGTLAGVAVTGNTNLGRNQRVTIEPYSLIGRTAAFYIGHMQAGGLPCLEAETMTRLVGRITSIDVGKVGGQYELSVDSILADAATALVAPGFPSYALKPGQICLAQPKYAQFEIAVGMSWDNRFSGPDRSRFLVSIPNIVYGNIYQLCAAINAAITTVANATPGGQGLFPMATLEDIDGQTTVVFKLFTSTRFGTQSVSVSNVIRGVAGGSSIDPSVTSCGLLSALGFTDGVDHTATSTETANTVLRIQADRPAPTIFYPLGFETGTVGNLQTVDLNSVFFGTVGGDQGDGGGAAYARVGSGQIARVILSSPPLGATGQLVLGSFPPTGLYGKPTEEGQGPESNYYYVEGKDADTATVEQVWLSPPSKNVAADPGNMLGRLMASTGMNYGGAGNLDCYPQGVGLGWNNILDQASILAIGGGDVQRAAVIDSKTKLSDLLTPLAKEYGFYLVWDPLLGKIAARKTTIPASPLSAQPVLSESNRVTVDDRTSQKIDQSALRSAWTLKWGWSRIQQKFLAPDFTLTDLNVQSSYGASIKGETIEDKTLTGQSGGSATAVLAEVFKRPYSRQPWLRCQRTLTKAGLVLAPGSVHSIVDNTIVNPFTGAPGVTAADGLYALLTSVSANPATGKCTVEFVLNREDKSQQYRAISPCALLDFAAGGNGYNNATGTVTLVNHFASDGTSFDGIDFVVGDKVTLISYNADQNPTYQQSSTITAVAVDGHTVSVASGLGAISGEEVVMILQRYSLQTAARQATLAFQGNENGTIQGLVPNHRWA